MEHTLDATGKSLGRVASTAAALLIGKNTKSFARNAVSGEKVNIVNASKANISQKKRREKKYVRYTGYPGGLKIESLDKVVVDKGAREAFRRAISGMLPKNKLKKEMLKNLIITE